MLPILVIAGILLVAAGFTLVTIAFILELLKSTKEKTEAEKHSGAVVMIGPMPIILASDPKTAKTLLTLAIILTIILVALTIFFYGLTSFE